MRMTAPIGEEAAMPRNLAIKRRSLYDEVADRLRDMIIEGEIAPGSRMNERSLCERLEISRTPLREAYKVLAAEGLLEISLNRGATVARLTIEEVDQTIEVMAALERLAGRLAATRIEEPALINIQLLHERLLAHHASGDLTGYFKCNQAIHLAIMEATHNAILAQQYGMLNARIRRYRYMANLSRERWDQSMREHEAIMAYLNARDPEALAATLSAHLFAKLNHVKQALTTDFVLAR
jgi:DNA-binding GntR family transcriptional regulator